MFFLFFFFVRESESAAGDRLFDRLLSVKLDNGPRAVFTPCPHAGFPLWNLRGVHCSRTLLLVETFFFISKYLPTYLPFVYQHWWLSMFLCVHRTSSCNSWVYVTSMYIGIISWSQGRQLSEWEITDSCYLFHLASQHCTLWQESRLFKIW